MTDIDTRRRRAFYRAHHRGTKEMDWLLGKFAEARIDALDEPQLSRFEELLTLPDPDLQTWILSGVFPDTKTLHDLLSEIRAFHGFDDGRGDVTA
ncbi:MAG: succinate dehydrogenase assembly factor 2 [Hyphomicrobiaceae bacterium]